MDVLIKEFIKALDEDTFIEAIWSNPRKKQEMPQKIVGKKIMLKEQAFFQFNLMNQNKSFHENILLAEVVEPLKAYTLQYKQLQLYTSSQDYTVLVGKKGNTHITKATPTKTKATSLSHNRQKNYLIETSTSATFLKALGLMGKNETINPSKYDKYKQINKYLEFIDNLIPSLPEGPLRIVDFGCGKSYLTFAMYHYLHEIKGKEVEVIGLDLKEDVILFCQKLAKELGYNKLFFQIGDIGSYTTDQTIDLVVSLHACNTATDAALLQAVNWKAKAILAVPCCHHEAYGQIKNDLLDPILKHGILKERIASLVTDGLRAQMLEAYGYKVSVMEFIDMQHTPKNILIRAILEGPPSAKALEVYHRICHELSLDLSIAKNKS
jgi:SAM-dependent methyltransferase